ncbi:MAG: SDR family oxidoreductase [Polyangiaceae bacterium]|nr:SDR family oxidoreductase [Polyangiaceae bacterium]
MSLSGKVALVTGANVGIGKETAVALARAGARTLIACRDATKGAAAVDEIKRRSGNEQVELVSADFASFARTRAFGDEVRARVDRLHVLVNNAGLMLTSRALTEDGHETMFQTNHLGYFLTTHLLLPLLRAAGSARVVNVASAAHRGQRLELDDLDSERSFSPLGTYGRSKLCNVYFTYELAERLRGEPVTVNCLHPGVVGTDFGQKERGIFRALVRLAHPFMMTPEAGAATQIHLATSPEVEGVTGQYFDKKRAVKSSRASYDVEVRRALWRESERLTRIARYGEP